MGSLVGLRRNPRPPSADHLPSPLGPRAPAGTQQVPFQFAALSGVGSSPWKEGGRTRCHGNASLPTLRPAPQPRPFQAQPGPASLAPGRHGGPTLPWGRRALGSRFSGLEGRRGPALRSHGQREGDGRSMGEKVFFRSASATLPSLPPTRTPQSNAAPRFRALGWGCRTPCFPLNVVQEPRGFLFF